MMNKKIIIIAITLIVISVLLFITALLIPSYQNEIYCSTSGMCYTYKGSYLEFYEDDNNSEDTYLDLFYHKCLYLGLFNTCEERVLGWTKKYMEVEIKYEGEKYIDVFYNVKEDKGKMKNINMSGNGYKNKKLQLYFVDENSVIVVGPNKVQQKCNYYISAYDFNRYTDIRYECSYNRYDKEDTYNTYSYNIKKKAISGFKKVKKEKLSLINFSYYDENYNYKELQYKNIDGHYKLEDKKKSVDLSEDVWIKGDHFRIKTSTYDVVEKVKIHDYNDKFIEFYYKGQSKSYFYDFQEDTLCGYSSCYEKVED